MVGEAALLDVEVPLPASVTLRRIDTEADVRAMAAMQDVAFGDPVSTHMADAVLDRLAQDDGMQLWVAESDGQVVGAGRLEPVDGLRLRRRLGRRGPARVAGAGHLPGPHRRPRPRGPRPGQDPRPQRLDGVLPTDPRTFRPGRGLDHHAVRVAAHDRCLIPRPPLTTGTPMAAWLAGQRAAFAALTGLTVSSWDGVEMALREESPDGPLFTDPDVRFLQLTWLRLRSDSGDRTVSVVPGRRGVRAAARGRRPTPLSAHSDAGPAR